MIRLDPHAAAGDAHSSAAGRPATALLHDSADARLVVFRIEAGQAVAPHTSPSTVILNVLAGPAILSGADGEGTFATGATVVYPPGEVHGMRATDSTVLLLATITPRPGER